MTIKVSTLLSHDTVLETDTAPVLGGPLNTAGFPIENLTGGGAPVDISGNEYPITTGMTGQVLTTNGFGILYWSTAGSGSVTSINAASTGPNATALTITGGPITSSGTLDFTLNEFSTSIPGIVPASPGGTTDFLRADGTWAVPPGGSGAVSQIIAGTNITISPIGGTGAVTINSTSGGLTGGANNEIPVMTGSTTNTYISAPSLANTFLEWNGSGFVWSAGGGGGSGTVTSVGLTSPFSSISISGSSSPITTSGTFDIDLPLSGITANSYGSASSVATFTVNSRGILSVASTVPISITPSQAGLGSVTNALQVINLGGAPSIGESSGIPVGSASTGALYLDQALTNGNGLYFYNGSSWVSVTKNLVLYVENPQIGYVPPSAAGTNSVAIGEGATTTALDSLAIGLQSLARTQGGVVQASGRFASTGDAQAGRYLLRSTTTNNVPTELFINGTAGGVRLALTDNSTWTFNITLTGHRTDASDGHAGFTAAGVIYRNAGAATTSLQGSVETTILSRSNPAWVINISADTANGALKITVTGESSKTIRWLALVETVEVTN